MISNRRRSREEMEYELIDTGIFDQDRYFDVVVEYAKESADDIAIRISAVNRGPEPRRCIYCPPSGFARALRRPQFRHRFCAELANGSGT